MTQTWGGGGGEELLKIYQIKGEVTPWKQFSLFWTKVKPYLFFFLNGGGWIASIRGVNLPPCILKFSYFLFTPPPLLFLCIWNLFCFNMCLLILMFFVWCFRLFSSWLGVDNQYSSTIPHFEISFGTPPPPLEWWDADCRSDWPGLCLFCCHQPSCVVGQPSWFLLFCFIHFLILPIPPGPKLPIPSADLRSAPTRLNHLSEPPRNGVSAWIQSRRLQVRLDAELGNEIWGG